MQKNSEEQLIHQNMGLVVQLAKSFHPHSAEELDEYIQLGRIGLLKAIRKHDPSRGALTTVAWHYIRWEIIRYLNANRQEHEVLFDEHAAPTAHSPVWELLPDSLSDTERQVVTLRAEGNHTFREIGQILGGFTRGWANKVFKAALVKIREANE